MSAALISALTEMYKNGISIPNSTEFTNLQLLALERELRSKFPSMINISTTTSLTAGHHPLVHSNSVTGSATRNSLVHRRLDRSASEPCSDRIQLQQQPRPAAATTNSSRYKTELCRPFEEQGNCKYGDKCQFAHGMQELRSLVRHPKYKTELCRTFHSTGLCPYGPRCHFIHNDGGGSIKNLAGLMSSASNVINIPSSGRSVADNRRHRDFDIGSFSLGSAGELSPNSSSSISGSPTSSSLYMEDLSQPVSPVPHTAPPFLSNVGFFDQDFVPPPFMPKTSPGVHRSHSPVDNDDPMFDINRNLRLPIFSQLGFDHLED